MDAPLVGRKMRETTTDHLLIPTEVVSTTDHSIIGVTYRIFYASPRHWMELVRINRAPASRSLTGMESKHVPACMED